MKAPCPLCGAVSSDKLSTGRTKTGTPIASFFCECCGQMFVVEDKREGNREDQAARVGRWEAEGAK